MNKTQWKQNYRCGWIVLASLLAVGAHASDDLPYYQEISCKTAQHTSQPLTHFNAFIEFIPEYGVANPGAILVTDTDGLLAIHGYYVGPQKLTKPGSGETAELFVQWDSPKYDRIGLSLDPDGSLVAVEFDSDTVYNCVYGSSYGPGDQAVNTAIDLNQVLAAATGSRRERTSPQIADTRIQKSDPPSTPANPASENAPSSESSALQ